MATTGLLLEPSLELVYKSYMVDNTYLTNTSGIYKRFSYLMKWEDPFHLDTLLSKGVFSSFHDSGISVSASLASIQSEELGGADGSASSTLLRLCVSQEQGETDLSLCHLRHSSSLVLKYSTSHLSGIQTQTVAHSTFSSLDCSSSFLRITGFSNLRSWQEAVTEPLSFCPTVRY